MDPVTLIVTALAWGSREGRHVVNVRGSQGVLIGDGNQFNTFNSVSSALGCEILVNGEHCRVEARGRCATCGRAMCLSHSAGKALCPVCRESQRIRALEIFEGIRPPDESPGIRRERRARERIQEIARRLAIAGIAPGSGGSESGPSGRGLAGRFRRTQGANIPVRGWHVGDYGWEVPDQEPRSDRVRTWKVARAFVTVDGRLMMEGDHFYREGGFYIPFMIAPYKNCADTFKGEPELWEEIASKMTDLARRQGVDLS
jgi:hypothetical protein